MPASEEIPDSVQRDLRPGIPGPLELDDYLPGSTIGTSIPQPQVETVELDNEITELEAVASDVEANIVNDMVSDYQSINSTAFEVQSNLEGEILNSLSPIEDLRIKLGEKLVDGIANELDYAYGLLVSLGFGFPSYDQVAYGNSTGDYLGSMLDPESVPVTPPPNVPISDNGNPPTGSPPMPEPPAGQGCFGFSWPEDDEFPAYVHNGVTPCLPIASSSTIRENYSAATKYDVTGVGSYIEPWLNLFGGTTNGEPSDMPYCTFRMFFCSPDGSSPLAVDVRLPLGFSPVYQISSGNVYGSNFVGYGFAPMPCYQLGRFCNVGQPPSDPPTDPPVQPPDPPTQPPANPGVCAVNNFNCGLPVKFPEFQALPVADTFCEQIQKWLDAAKLGDRRSFADVFSMQWDSNDTDSGVLKKLKTIFGSQIPVVPDLLNRFGRWLDKAYDSFQHSYGCNNIDLAGPQFMLSMMRVLNQYVPFIPQATIEAQTQIVNSMCQYRIPNGSEANMMFMADVIDKETWRCLHKANGNYVNEQEKITQAMRTRLDPFHISKLYRTKLFGKDVFEKFMREAGVLTELDREMLHETTRSWPGISDVQRFLVRDVADDEIVNKYGMDDDFDKKWRGNLIDYADAIGVGKDLGRYYWRAHWHIPSFTMLKEMAARLRPGRVDKEFETTDEDMFNALKQDDWLPFWAKRLMQIGRPAVPKSEIVKAYNLHAIDEAELLERFKDLGYVDKDAEMYVEYHKTWRKRDERKKAGWPTLSALVKQYSQCLITLDQLRETLTKLAMSEEQINEAIEAAKLTSDIEFRRMTISGIMYQYKRGLISEAEAHAALANADVPAGCVPALVQRWTSQRQKIPKQLQAAQLCKLRKYGVITSGEQIASLVRSGYDPLAASRIADLCTFQLTEQQAKENLREAQRAKREYDRQVKEEAKRRKLEVCGPPPCPANTPGGKQTPPAVP